jgi:hypothetical protein
VLLCRAATPPSQRPHDRDSKTMAGASRAVLITWIWCDKFPHPLARDRPWAFHLSPYHTSLTVAEPKTYDQLPHPRYIRLFRVDRAIFRPIGPKSFDVSIYGTLEPFDWEEAPPYSALSYTWGHPYVNFNLAEPEPVPEITSHIIVNGEVLRVTDNLHSALASVTSGSTPSASTSRTRPKRPLKSHRWMLSIPVPHRSSAGSDFRT